MPKKVDSNQNELFKKIRQVGATVQDISMVGHGCPDALIGFRGKNYLIEIKDGNKPKSKRKLTPNEAEFMLTWQGQARVVNDIMDIYEMLGILGIPKC